MKLQVLKEILYFSKYQNFSGGNFSFEYIWGYLNEHEIVNVCLCSVQRFFIIPNLVCKAASFPE